MPGRGRHRATGFNYRATPLGRGTGVVGGPWSGGSTSTCVRWPPLLALEKTWTFTGCGPPADLTVRVATEANNSNSEAGRDTADPVKNSGQRRPRLLLLPAFASAPPPSPQPGGVGAPTRSAGRHRREGGGKRKRRARPRASVVCFCGGLWSDPSGLPSTSVLPTGWVGLFIGGSARLTSQVFAPSSQFRARARSGFAYTFGRGHGICYMGSSVGCLGGGSKSGQDHNRQAVAGSSPRSGLVLSRARNIFSLNELKMATRNFHMMNCIGRGGFGAVYKGNLKDGTQIAIKKLSAESKQGINEFLTEIDVISNVRHPNLIKLIGCCVEGNNRLLVYEYAENNSLANALLGPKNKCIPLDWPKRAAICIGTASGLAFLHEEAQPRIVHRDIKASNILLDKKLLPKIGDFGLAKLFPDTITHISTRVAGTMGYLAPEYALLGQLTKKADIYSFGVLLLEVISGQSSSKSTWGPDMLVLVEWTWKLREEGRLLEVVDPELQKYPEEQMLRFIKVALLCTQATSQQRPSMKQVVNMLSNQTEIDLQNVIPPGVLKEPRPRASGFGGGFGGLTVDTSSSQSTKCNPAESYSTQTNMNSGHFSTTDVSPR